MTGSMDCGMPTEAQLQRHCGTLYITHGLESTCGLVMFVFFSIVAVKLHVRSHLRSPVVAVVRFTLYNMYLFLEEFFTTLLTVGQMDKMNLEVRLRFCTNMDKMCNATSAVLSALGVTRWLSIGNVNGMRYIGYAMTCPMTQVELVVMLAPIIPCFRFLAFLGFALTFITLTCGYTASLLWMPVWEGDLIKFLHTHNIEDFAPTQKAYAVIPALCGIGILWVLVLPYLMIMYTWQGGNKNNDLPQEYRFLVMLVWCTWIGFPCWWFMSWEGNGLITNTKINEIGFTFLNIVAKGAFTLQSFRVSSLNDERVAARRSAREEEEMRRSGRCVRHQTFEGKNVPAIVSRKSSMKLERSQFVHILRQFDIEEETDSDASSGSDGEEQLKKTATGKAGDKPALAPFA